MDMHIIDKAIKVAGGKTALARKLGTYPQLVDNWSRRKSIPAEYAPAIERITNGAIRAEDLCPGVDWAYIRGTRPPVPPEGKPT
jgi:DNA-binding transcriptional regulator YdaS (Cro superfamily)